MKKLDQKKINELNKKLKMYNSDNKNSNIGYNNLSEIIDYNDYIKYEYKINLINAMKKNQIISEKKIIDRIIKLEKRRLTIINITSIIGLILSICAVLVGLLQTTNNYFMFSLGLGAGIAALFGSILGTILRNKNDQRIQKYLLTHQKISSNN